MIDTTCAKHPSNRPEERCELCHREHVQAYLQGILERHAFSAAPGLELDGPELRDAVTAVDCKAALDLLDSVLGSLGER